MVAAFEVAQYSSSLVTAAPRIVAAQDIEELDLVYGSISDASDSLEAELHTLETLLGETGCQYGRLQLQRTA